MDKDAFWELGKKVAVRLAASKEAKKTVEYEGGRVNGLRAQLAAAEYEEAVDELLRAAEKIR